MVVSIFATTTQKGALMLDWIFLLAIPAYLILDHFLWPAAGFLSYMAYNAAHGVALEACALSTISMMRMAAIFLSIHIMLGVPLTHPILFVLCLLDFRHGVHKAAERIDVTDEKEALAILRFTRGILCGQVALAVGMAAVIGKSLL
jgi:hypothetical protein